LREEWQKSDESREAGNLPDLPPTREMAQIQQLIAEREAVITDEIPAEKAKELVDQLRMLHQAYYVRDTVRRIPPRPQPVVTGGKFSLRIFLTEQCGPMLINPAVLSAGDGTRRILHVGLTVLLCLSLLTVTANGAVAAALNDEALRLAQVNIQRQHTTAQQQVVEALAAQTSPTTRSLTATEVTNIRAISKLFAQAVEHSPALGTVDASEHDLAAIHNAHLRAQILQTLQADPRVSLESVRSLAGPARETAERIDHGFPTPNDRIAQAADEELTNQISRLPESQSTGLLDKMRRSFALHGSPAAPGTGDIVAAIRGQAFTTLYDVTFGGGSSDVVAEFANALGEGSSESLKAYGSAMNVLVKTGLDDFTTTLTREGPEAAVSGIGQPGSNLDRYGDALFGRVRHDYTDAADWNQLLTETWAHPPAAPPKEPSIPAWAQAEPLHGHSEFATTFADIAPAGLGDDLRSPRNQIEIAEHHRLDPDALQPNVPTLDAPVAPEVAADLRNVEEHGVEAVFNDAAKSTAVADEVVEVAGGLMRSRSYSLLSGFSRIGGVLIGAGPASDSGLDCRTVDWQTIGRMVTLKLSGPKCPWQGAPIDRDTLGRALAYAADGRPVATTMVSSSPLLDGLSVHPHPVLVDSQIGREASKIDMFIDTYYRYGDGAIVDPNYAEAANEVDGQIALYHSALALREAELASRLNDKLPADFVRYLKQESTVVTRQESDNEITGALRSHRRNARSSPVRASILRAKPAFFDSDLTNIVEACEGRSVASAFRGCVHEQLDKLAIDWSHPSDGDRDRLKVWLQAHIVDYHLESGVREVPYTTADALHVTDNIAPGADGIGPFRFEIHVTFYSTPAFGKNQADTLRQDEHPYDFPSLEPGIRARLVAEARTHHDMPITLHRMAAFTRAQRLFRLALEGKLGAEFPSERLVALADQLARTPSPKERTMRWLAHPMSYVGTAARTIGELQRISKPSGAGPVAAVAAEFYHGLLRCSEVGYEGYRATNQLIFDDASCDPRLYERSLSMLKTCSSDDCETIRYTVDLLRVMRLRKDLGVSVDDTDQLTPSAFFPT
jgi:hypothetical protein